MQSTPFVRLGVLTALLFGCVSARAQIIIIDPPTPIRPPHPVPPRPRPPVPWPSPGYTLEVKNQNYESTITDGVAVTKVDQTFHNASPHQVEGTYVFPLPATASVSGFSMFVNGEELAGELLDVEKARGIYQSIVSSMRDPALLEYLGSRLYRARIFPIPAGGDVRVTMRYQESLPVDAGLATLELPFKADARASKAAEKTSVLVRIRSQIPIGNVFSPSHAVDVNRTSENEATISYESSHRPSDRDFVVHYLLSEKDFGLAMLTYREPGQDGFFMVRIAPPAKVDADAVLRKDITFVFDTSGSMSGEKIEQARNALKFCLNSLGGEDRFNVISFSHEPRAFKESLVTASREAVREAINFVESITAGGGTNINDALLKALRGTTNSSDRPHLIVFLTDGEPTIGVTDPEAILKNVSGANESGARLYVFGVGDDVNTNLLDRLAEDNRGARQYVRPSENIEVKVSGFYRKVSDPVLSNLVMDWGSLTVHDVYPPKLPDLFSGGEIVLVGRFRGHGSFALELTGTRRDSKERFVYERVMPETDTGHEFLPRLWAVRKIGYLLDEIRLHGEKRELKDEVVRLAKLYGVLTPYTAYLVTEKGESPGFVSRPQQVLKFQGYRGRSAGIPAPGIEQGNMQADRLGADAVDASVEISGMQHADGLTGEHDFSMPPNVHAMSEFTSDDAGHDDGNHHRFRQESARRAAGRTFYWIDGRWVDSEFDDKIDTTKVEPFSEAYFELIGKHPALAKILAMGERVVFKWNGKWYEIKPSGDFGDTSPDGDGQP